MHYSFAKISKISTIKIVKLNIYYITIVLLKLLFNLELFKLCQFQKMSKNSILHNLIYLQIYLIFNFNIDYLNF